MSKKLILSTFLILFGLSTVFAQKSLDERAEEFASEMQSVIGFDNKDKEKVKDAQMKREEAMDKLKDKIQSKYPTKEEREEKRTQIKDEFQIDRSEIKKDFDERILRVITEAQFAKWQEYKKDQRAQGGKGNGKGGKGNGGEHEGHGEGHDNHHRVDD